MYGDANVGAGIGEGLRWSIFTYLRVLLGVRVLSLLLKMRLLHVRWQADLAHGIISHGGKLCSGHVHAHVHGHTVSSHVAVAHLLGYDALLLERALLLL